MSSPPPAQPKIPRISPGLIGVGVLVIALGFGLPMLTSGSSPESTSPEPAAKQVTAAGTPAPIEPPSMTGLGVALLRLVAGLVVVCGLCVFVARKFGQKQPIASTTMEVLASIVVARTVLHLVRAGERRLLIGTDLTGVKAILELPGPAPEQLPEVVLAPATPATADASAMSPAFTSAPESPTPSTPPAGFSQEVILKLLTALRAQRDASPPA